MSETNKYLTIMNKQKNGKALHLEHAAEEICFESLDSERSRKTARIWHKSFLDTRRSIFHRL